jgi:hypothetical protein
VRQLVTSATPAQLTVLLDLDLWRHARPGRDHLFDVDRFGEWLEVLADTGNSVAARTVAALDKNLVVAGLSRYVRVFDPGIFEPTAQSDDEPTDRREAMREGDVMDVGKALCAGRCIRRRSTIRAATGSSVSGRLFVRATRTDAWDAIVTILFALDADHRDYFHAVMRGCRRLSNSTPETDGRTICCRHRGTSRRRIERERGDHSKAATPPTRAPSSRWRDSRNTRDQERRDGIDQSIDRHGILSSGGRSTGIVERDCAIAGTQPESPSSPSAASHSSDVHAHATGVPIARSGHGTPDRGRRDAGASARAARSRGRRPAGRQAHALAAADGVRPRHARDRILHAQS